MDAPTPRSGCRIRSNRPPPKPLRDAQMGGAFSYPGAPMKPSLTSVEQVDLMTSRGLHVGRPVEAAALLERVGYYRFTGSAPSFQRAVRRDEFERNG